jgi:hypothetical protein
VQIEAEKEREQEAPWSHAPNYGVHLWNAPVPVIISSSTLYIVLRLKYSLKIVGGKVQNPVRRLLSTYVPRPNIL